MGLRRPHAVADRPVAAYAKELVDLVSSLKAGIGGGIRIGNFVPAPGNVIRQPFDIGLGTGFIGIDGFLFPVTLPLHAVIGFPESQALNIAGQRVDALRTQPLKRRHDRGRAREPWIDKMGDVPIVRVFAALLGQINPGALRSQRNGFVGKVVAGLRNAFRPVAPIEGTNGLTVAVDTAVLQINFTALSLYHGPFPEDVGRIRRAGGIRPVDHCQCNCSQQG